MSEQLLDVITLGMALAALIVSVIFAARSGKNIDQATADKLAEMHRPEVMDRLERAYQQSNAERKQLVDVTSGFLKLIAQFTPFKSIDAASELLEDIQTPGPAPVSPPVAQSAG